jgi:hypothetical protein
MICGCYLVGIRCKGAKQKRIELRSFELIVGMNYTVKKHQTLSARRRPLSISDGRVYIKLAFYGANLLDLCPAHHLPSLPTTHPWIYRRFCRAA